MDLDIDLLPENPNSEEVSIEILMYDEADKLKEDILRMYAQYKCVAT